MALEQDERSGPRVGNRSSRILGGSGGARSAAIAAVSTVVVFGVLVLVVVNAPNWPEVKEQFFNWDVFKNSFPDIAEAFRTNVKLFLIAEVFILVFALFLAVLRSLPGPVFFPLRVLSTAYTDVFRGIPTILLVYLLGFGIPGLQLQGVPNSQFFWAAVALVLVYSAYVAEVYRAGIESIHPSQSAAARSLGLTHAQSMRYVVLPQAVRRVIPPLLNDFIGLQKDTALVQVIGMVDAFNQSRMIASNAFNLSAVTIVAILFVLVTIPQARFVDKLIERDNARIRAGG